MAQADIKKTPAAWTRNLLLGSAALNIFLAGFLVANLFKDDVLTQQTPPPTPITLGLPPELPLELREAFENNFNPHRRDIEENYENLVRARLKIGDLLANFELDQDELDEALEEIRDLQFEIQGSIHDSMIETLINLDPENRIEFVMGSERGERGIWSQRQFDGSRWRVVVEDGEIVVDFLGNRDDDEDEDADPDPRPNPEG